MKKRPFSILPSSGYRNSQFQIVTTVDNLQIDFIHDGITCKSVTANSKYPTVLLHLDSVGKYTARAEMDGVIFEQEIKVADAMRLGSSTLKSTYLFDNSNFSFFLMKDRLHIYSHVDGKLLTENSLSPSEILQFDESHYVFVTRIGSGTNKITNFGLFNTHTLSMDGELLNKYQEIAIHLNNNNVWLYNPQANSIHCFKILNKSGEAFASQNVFEELDSYVLSDDKKKLFIHYSDHIVAIRLKDCLQYDIPKDENNAADNFGTVFYLLEGKLECHNEFDDIRSEVEWNAPINLNGIGFIHVGNDFQKDQDENGFKSISDKIMTANLSNIPEGVNWFKCDVSGFKTNAHLAITHRLFATQARVFLYTQTITKTLQGVDLRKIEATWSSTPVVKSTTSYELMKLNDEGNQVQLLSSDTFINVSRVPECLVAKDEKQTLILNGQGMLKAENPCIYHLLDDSDYSYLLVKEQENYLLYSQSNFDIPILKNVKIHNLPYIHEHGIIWYSGPLKTENPENSHLAGFVLSLGSSLHLDEMRAHHSIFKDADDYIFRSKYILSSNQLVINPNNGVILDSIIGSIVSTSPGLLKLVARRDEHLYMRVFDTETGKYDETEINLDQKKIMESYLSPNGKHLVLKEEANKYLWYDIEKAETIRFLSGRFLAFSSEGNLVIEEDSKRAVRIYDPLTFADITPPNYQHFRFLSPDGALYAQVHNPHVRYISVLNKMELSSLEVKGIELKYDLPAQLVRNRSANYSYYQSEKKRVDTNRRNYFNQNEVELRKVGINNHHQVSYEKLVKAERYINIGIVGTEVTAEIVLPSDLEYYNYSSFSFDNQYFGYVGKPHSNGLIHLFKLNYNSLQQTLAVEDSYITRYPRYASWVCGFSKTGYFATYDSTPDTYIIKVTEHLFKSSSTDHFIRSNLKPGSFSISRSFRVWHEISGKNYLCFSPSGRFIAVSEQGYEPLTLGGYGHQESNSVHIAETETGKIVDSFTAHGASIKQDKYNKLTFVAFSEDEGKVMTLSDDGVVVVRSIELD